MINKIKRYINKTQMIQKHDHLILGVSGGADSVCLLHVLKVLSGELGFTLEVCHVEHGIRGEESQEDADFTRKLCQQLEVEFREFHVDVPAYAHQEGLGLEEAARILRYDIFLQRAKFTNGKVALAHHMDDNAETVLFQMIRGSGITGLTGMKPVRDIYIRPLLCVSRKEIEGYLEAIKQKYCVDSTNTDTDYSRNLLRLSVIPDLTKINEQAVAHINKSANMLLELQKFVDQQIEISAEHIINEIKTENNKGQYVVLNIGEMEKFPDIIKGELILRGIEKVCHKRKDITSNHVAAVMELIQNQSGKRVDLPYKIQAFREYDSIVIQAKNNEKNYREDLQQFYFVTKEQLEDCRNNHREIEVLLENPSAKICLSVRKFDGNTQEIPQKPYTKWIDYGMIRSGFHIRKRKSGDFFVNDCHGHHKKLKDYFINEKIPARERDMMWLIAQEAEIICIPGPKGRLGETYKVLAETEDILEIRYNGGN